MPPGTQARNWHTFTINKWISTGVVLSLKHSDTPFVTLYFVTVERGRAFRLPEYL